MKKMVNKKLDWNKIYEIFYEYYFKNILLEYYFLKNSIDFTSPTVPVIITSPPGAA